MAELDIEISEDVHTMALTLVKLAQLSISIMPRLMSWLKKTLHEAMQPEH